MSKTLILLAKNHDNKKVIPLMNNILKYLITTLTTEDSSVANEYLNYFDVVVNNLNNNKIEINKEILDYVNALGSFGKNNNSRRYSAYLCSSVFRVHSFL
jgi:hypothetical protein